MVMCEEIIKKRYLEKLWNGVHLRKRKKGRPWEVFMDPRNNNWNDSKGTEQYRIDGQGRMER